MRLGVIGTGHMAREMAATAGAVSGVEISAVLSRKAGSAGEFAAAHAPDAAIFAETEPFLEAVDAVYVATPPTVHGDAVTAALAAGRPVLCEKPLTASLGDTERLIDEARGCGTLLMETLWTLTLPAFRALEARMAGYSGPPPLMTFDFSFPFDPPAGSHYLEPASGGVLLDRAVYGYAAAIRLLGPVSRQEAHVTRDAAGLDRSAELRLEHDEGGTSVITLSFDRLGPNRLDVAMGGALASLEPSLGAEALSWKSGGGTGAGGSGTGLKSRLKAMPLLRRLARHRQRQAFTFLGYGASLYAPLLGEFRDTVARGASESALAPLQLSRDIAALTEKARA